MLTNRPGIIIDVSNYTTIICIYITFNINIRITKPMYEQKENAYA